MTAVAAEVEVKERPIVFSGPMVKAILASKKTQTRRVIKPQPLDSWMNGTADWSEYYKRTRFGFKKHLWIAHPTENKEIVCPYGAPGDRLWIRESFAHLADLKTKDPGTAALMSRAFFRADHPTGLSHDDATDLKWRSPLFLPRDLCRITLEITNVRVERLQEISEADAIAEGAIYHDTGVNNFKQKRAGWSMTGETDWRKCLDTARFAFANGWNKLNAKRGFSWDSNPFVWCITFKKL